MGADQTVPLPQGSLGLLSMCLVGELASHRDLYKGEWEGRNGAGWADQRSEKASR